MTEQNVEPLTELVMPDGTVRKLESSADEHIMTHAIDTTRENSGKIVAINGKRTQE